MSRTFIIAGASSGIGLALAQRLIANGHRVIGVNRTAGVLEQGPNYEFIPFDFTSGATLPDLDAEVSGLVYCPGSIRLKGFRQIKAEELQQDFDLNVKGAFLFIQKYAPQITRASTGSIVLFSSVAAATGLPFHTSVSVSKAAIEGLTRSLAAELSPEITVNCIAPSLTDTPLAGHLLNSDSKREMNGQRHAMKRVGSVEDIASLAEFLLCDATWITGQVMGVNGGMGSVIK